MSIKITVKLFAIYQEVYQQPELIFRFDDSVTVGDILNKILQEKPELKQWEDVTRFGVNLQFVEKDTVLHNGDEVVLIPPVSGG